MPVHFASALTIARYLEGRPEVESVSYPFLESHPQHELAKKLMRGGSGLVSFRLATWDIGGIKAFVNAFTVFKRAVSWGGYESLVFPEAAALAPLALASAPPAGSRANAEATDCWDKISLIRLNIGLESPELLIEDLDRAFTAMKRE